MVGKSEKVEEKTGKNMLRDPRIGNPTYHEQLEGKIKKGGKKNTF